MVTFFRFYYSLSFKLNTEKNTNEQISCPHYVHITARVLIVQICIVHKMYMRAGLSGFLASVKEV